MDRSDLSVRIFESALYNPDIPTSRHPERQTPYIAGCRIANAQINV